MTTKKTKKPRKSSKTAAKSTPEETAKTVDPSTLSPEEQVKRNERITFVANNILNNLTLNQAVNIIQQISLRDAATIVDTGDDAKTKEIDDAMEAQRKAAEEAAAQQATGAPDPSETKDPVGDVEQAEPELATAE